MAKIKRQTVAGVFSDIANNRSNRITTNTTNTPNKSFERETNLSIGSVIVKPLKYNNRTIPIPFNLMKDSIMVKARKSHPFQTKHWVTAQLQSSSLVCFFKKIPLKELNKIIAFKVINVKEKAVMVEPIFGNLNDLKKYYEMED